MERSRTLYRKYRPRQFSEVVGQQQIVRVLETSLKNGSFTHAYLFTGPHGVGKTSIARIFAHGIIGKPCEDDQSPLDIIEIDAASNRRIEEIRSLKDKVNMAPIDSKYKVYIIDEVHMLTKEAFNALLKTLEEPPSHVVFILATTEASSLPATIISRTQRHNFKPYSQDEVKELLQEVVNKEELNLSDEDLGLVATQAKGSMRDALSILNRLDQNTRNVADALGMSDAKTINDFMQAVLSDDLRGCFNIIDALVQNGTEIKSFVEQLIQHIIDSQHNNKAFELAKELMGIKGSAEPVTLLKITVAETINFKDATPEKTTTEVKSAPPVNTKPVEQAEVEVQDDTAEQEAEPTKPDIPTETDEPIRDEREEESPEPEISPAESPSVQSGDFEWSKFMTHLRTADRSIYTILRMTEARVEGQVLHLACKFDLHYKKINDPEFKAKLNRQLQPYNIKSIKLEKDGEVTSAAASNEPEMLVKGIMGGGEVVKLGAEIS